MGCRAKGAMGPAAAPRVCLGGSWVRPLTAPPPYLVHPPHRPLGGALPFLSRDPTHPPTVPLPGATDCSSYFRLGVKGVLFQPCERTSLCYAPSWVCDGSNDCGDYSDERNCPGRPAEARRAQGCTGGPGGWQGPHTSPLPPGVKRPRCPLNYFACPSGRCIPMSWTCDKEDDCENGEDETHCSE